MSIKLTAASVAALLMAAPALAADMNGIGGNCCADLEERVAELEATTARKDNRKVSLTVYGQVNYAILDVNVDTPWEGVGFSDTTITNNSNAQSRVGFKGSANINADWSAGFVVELGLGEPDDAAMDWKLNEFQGDGVLDDALVIRHSALYLRHSQLGAFWIGKTSTATDGIAEISVANTANASTLLSLEPVSGAWLGGGNLPFDGGRTDVVKWVSPTVGGFTASVAWMGNEDDAWDAALRYAGELGDFKVAAGVGYRKQQSPLASVLPGSFGEDGLSDDLETIAGSASVMHVPSGLFVSGAAGKVDGVAGSGVLFVGPWTGNAYPLPFVDARAYHLQGGIEKNFFGFGATTLFGEWGRVESDTFTPAWWMTYCPPEEDDIKDLDVDFWGLGVNQAIDGAAMDLYVSYRKYDASIGYGVEGDSVSHNIDTEVIVGGAVIRF